MERSAKRAESARRQEARRIAGIRSRALERELIRTERAAERERIRAERETERLSAEAYKASVRRNKQEAKEAQLAEWRREVEAHIQRDEDLLQIGNDSPEVEDRDALYQRMLQEHPYEPPEFEPPKLNPGQVAAIRQHYLARMDDTLREFTPPRGGIETLQLYFGAAAVARGGMALIPQSPAVVPWVCAGGIGVWLVLEVRRRKARQAAFDARSAEVRQATEAAVAAECAAKQHALDITARGEYERQIGATRAEHTVRQAQRHAQLRALQAGELDAMATELAGIFPLEERDAWATRSTLKSSTEVALEVFIPLPRLVQVKSASILASGKPSYKKKTQKRFREECERIVAGIALRHASEVMLLLPSVTHVAVRCVMPAMNPSTGRDELQELLAVTYDFATLAPLEMANIDAYAALEHFPHQETIKDVARTLLIEASE